MTNIDVNTSMPYQVMMDNGILTSMGGIIQKLSRASRALVVTDSNVAPLYLEAAVTSLQDSGLAVSTFVLKAGERSKTLQTVEAIVKTAAENRLDRRDVIVALGGGVVGDLAGFAAAIYLRGIDCVQVPTSLLSLIDSSIGGKTGCDLPSGKNLVGAFHSPLLVLCDPDCLKTLPQENFADGISEMIKTAAIKDEKLFKKIKQGYTTDDLPKLIEQSINIKRVIVEADEFEVAERKLLNFGHTIGHAIECCQNYNGLSHGQAVSIGMAMITKASQNVGLTDMGVYEELTELLQSQGLPISCDIPLSDICGATLSDKKRMAKRLPLVLLRRLGESYIHTIHAADLEAFLS